MKRYLSFLESIMINRAVYCSMVWAGNDGFKSLKLADKIVDEEHGTLLSHEVRNYFRQVQVVNRLVARLRAAHKAGKKHALVHALARFKNAGMSCQPQLNHQLRFTVRLCTLLIHAANRASHTPVPSQGKSGTAPPVAVSAAAISASAGSSPAAPSASSIDPLISSSSSSSSRSPLQYVVVAPVVEGRVLTLQQAQERNQHKAQGSS